MGMWGHNCLPCGVEKVKISLSLLFSLSLSVDKVVWYVLDSPCVDEVRVDLAVEVFISMQ